MLCLLAIWREETVEYFSILKRISIYLSSSTYWRWLRSGFTWPSSRNGCLILETVPCESDDKSEYVSRKSATTSTWVRRTFQNPSVTGSSIRKDSVRYCVTESSIRKDSVSIAFLKIFNAHYSKYSDAEISTFGKRSECFCVQLSPKKIVIGTDKFLQK